MCIQRKGALSEYYYPHRTTGKLPQIVPAALFFPLYPSPFNQSYVNMIEAKNTILLNKITLFQYFSEFGPWQKHLCPWYANRLLASF